MKNILLNLTGQELREISSALRAGRVGAPFLKVALQRFCLSSDASNVAQALNDLSKHGMTPEHCALLLELLEEERKRHPSVDEELELVLTGFDLPEIYSRSTQAVVPDLFTRARKSIIVAGYAVYQGCAIFRSLADRMTEDPTIEVLMFLDVHRAFNDTTTEEDLMRRFAHNFKSREWPGEPFPIVYCYPRSLFLDPVQRAALHAKCIIVDESVVFISSANFTEAAQTRNIEVGILVESSYHAKKLSVAFRKMIEAKKFVLLPGF